MKASDIVSYQGKKIDRLTYERMMSLNRLVKSTRFGGEKADITWIQGIGGAVPSGGTHLTGGCVDTTPYNHEKREYGGRLLGGADWYRSRLPGVWEPHIHFNTAGIDYSTAAARQQVTAYWAGKNGLANNGKDTGPRLATKPLFVAPWTERGARGVYYAKKGVVMRQEGSDKTKGYGTLPKGGKFTVIAVVNSGGVLWAMNVNGYHIKKSDLETKKPTPPKPPTPKKTVRIGSLNFPDKEKISTATEAQRIKRAVEQINEANLDIVGIQEGVARKSATEASGLMARLDTALGADWEVIIPTTETNENYYFKRKAIESDQHEDAVIRGSLGGVPLGGRHVSLVTFDTDIGKITVGNTQLINDNRPGAEVQAKAAAKALNAIGGPRLILGDFNTDGPLAGFTHAGLHDSRTIARTTSNRDAVTYTNQHKMKPSSNTEWRIDGIWVSDGISVLGYNVILDLDKDGFFVQKRVSDHSLVIISISM